MAQNEINQIERILEDGGLYHEGVRHNGLFFTVNITWGDWKHEHLRCKWLLEKKGFKQIGEDVTEEDGSDCYSSVHHFIKA